MGGSRRFGRRPVVLAVLAALVIAVASAGAGYAVHDATTIHACARHRDGALRLVADAGLCDDHREAAVEWNKAGAPGPEGPQGPQGPEGPQGPAGPSGVVGAHHVFALGELDSINRKTMQVLCPDGEVAVGGGYNIGKVSQDGPPVAVQQSLAVLDADGKTPIGWRMEATEVVPTDEDWRAVVTAVCVPTS